MRYSSVPSTTTVPPRPRRRLGFLPCSRWRFPARERNTLPLAVILNRLATDFLVLMPFGRRIKYRILLFEKSAKYKCMPQLVQAVFCLTALLLGQGNGFIALRWPLSDSTPYQFSLSDDGSGRQRRGVPTVMRGWCRLISCRGWRGRGRGRPPS